MLLHKMIDGARSERIDERVSDSEPYAFEHVIEDICRLPWERLQPGEVLEVAQAYYYFSVQFRENLEIACRLYPQDTKLKQLYADECKTDNLSPWPDVAAVGEKLDHDEFLRRALSLQDIERSERLDAIGHRYLEHVRNLDNEARATSIASYEDGGLSQVFQAILRAPRWQGRGADAFRFFLEQHISFDSDEDGGHGALARHLQPDDSILPLWVAFRDLLATAPSSWQKVGERRH